MGSVPQRLIMINHSLQTSGYPLVSVSWITIGLILDARKYTVFIMYSRAYDNNCVRQLTRREEALQFMFILNKYNVSETKNLRGLSECELDLDPERFPDHRQTKQKKVRTWPDTQYYIYRHHRGVVCKN